MTPDDFHFLARLLRRRSGISLNLDKMALAMRRLTPVMRRFGFKDMDALIRELRNPREALADAVVQAMTVNETSFFRDPDLFQRFRDTTLPRLLRARQDTRRLRIWSAGCASGQEAYTIAMILTEMGLVADGWSVELVATDISVEALHRAETGLYAAPEIQRGLDAGSMLRHFRREDEGWRVRDDLRRMVTFRRFNLLDSFGWLDDLDILFCRNVLIYFDRATRIDILERMSDTLASDGVLLLGESEGPESLIPVFAQGMDGRGIYERARASVALFG